MSNNVKKPVAFDVKTVEALAAVMSEHDLSEICWRDGEQQLRLRRGGAIPVAVQAPMPPSSTPATASHSAPARSEPTPEAAPAGRSNLLEIKSETVGTFYAAPKPGEPPYVKVGDRITANQPVGLVEVMKTYNELQAGCSGIIREILVTDGQAVEFGQVLFRVDPS